MRKLKKSDSLCKEFELFEEKLKIICEIIPRQEIGGFKTLKKSINYALDRFERKTLENIFFEVNKSHSRKVCIKDIHVVPLGRLPGE